MKNSPLPKLFWAPQRSKNVQKKIIYKTKNRPQNTSAHTGTLKKLNDYRDGAKYRYQNRLKISTKLVGSLIMWHYDETPLLRTVGGF